MKISPGKCGAQITGHWGSEWILWDTLRSAYALVKSQHLAQQSRDPIHLSLSLLLPTTPVLRSDRNPIRDTEEEDLANRVTLTTSQGHPSLSFPIPKAHAVSEAAGWPF